MISLSVLQESSPVSRSSRSVVCSRVSRHWLRNWLPDIVWPFTWSLNGGVDKWLIFSCYPSSYHWRRVKVLILLIWLPIIDLESIGERQLLYNSLSILKHLSIGSYASLKWIVLYLSKGPLFKGSVPCNSIPVALWRILLVCNIPTARLIVKTISKTTCY